MLYQTISFVIGKLSIWHGLVTLPDHRDMLRTSTGNSMRNNQPYWYVESPKRLHLHCISGNCMNHIKAACNKIHSSSNVGILDGGKCSNNRDTVRARRARTVSLLLHVPRQHLYCYPSHSDYRRVAIRDDLLSESIRRITILLWKRTLTLAKYIRAALVT